LEFHFDLVQLFQISSHDGDVGSGFDEVYGEGFAEAG
jgi:hypothetical protein